MSDNSFNEWCIVELFGHTRIAGKVSDQVIGGETFIRVDVPEHNGRPGFTRMYGKGAVYSISPVSEEIAREVSGKTFSAPVDRFEVRHLLPLQISENAARRTDCDVEPGDQIEGFLDESCYHGE